MVSNKPKANSGGSALKRLKKSLQSAGVVGQQAKASRSKKDRKKGKPTERVDLDKKLSHIRGEFNPFETKVQRTKFEILGRKMKGTQGKPTLSKQVGEENRKKTLLLEMKNKHRRGGIIDKRFGESNPHLTPEEKMLERFTREKQKSSRGSMFNLDDDDEDLSLTHYGQSLATMDDFDDAGLALSDEDEDKQMDKNIVSKLHFGGFEENEPEEERHKSKHEIMKEIIAKSKMHKAERQAAKAEDEELRENLDDELNEIRDLLETKPVRKPLPSQTALFRKTESEQVQSDDLEDYSEYDSALMELASDRRAMATDRTKTEEEIALEEKEKLEKAERARKRRMEGLESEDEDDHKKGRKKRKNAPQADDLDDDYLEELEDEVNKLGKGLTLEDIQNGAGEDEEEDEDEEDEDEEDEDEEEEEEEEDEETDNEDIEGSDDEVPEFGADNGDDMNEFGTSGMIKKSKKSNTKTTAGKKREIPYTFECPTSHDEFLTILDDLEVEDVLVVTQRIRVLYHVKLNPENKGKLSGFLGVLVDHVAYIASTVSPMPMDVLEKLSAHIFDISQQVPEASADVFTDRLRKMQGEMGKKMKFNTGSSWPDVEDLMILRNIGQVFSTSDLNHPVGTPAMLFICHALSQCRIQTEVDIGRGLFLTQILYEYQKVSKRFIPESLNFLYKNLVILAPQDTFQDNVPGYFPFDKPLHMAVVDMEGKDLQTISPVRLEELSTEMENDDNRLSLVQGTLRQLEKYLQLYASTPALKEIFESLLEIIEQLSVLNWHQDIKASSTLFTTLKGRLERQIKFCIEKRTKTPLRMQQHRPVPIAQHLPKFEKAYSMDRHYDPDHERSQLRKLESQVKKEKKGALRELRKDNQFMAREKAKERKEKDEEYNKMVKGVMHLLEGEQSEMKQLEREKAKK